MLRIIFLVNIVTCLLYFDTFSIQFISQYILLFCNYTKIYKDELLIL